MLRNLADLVEEDRAASGFFKQPFLIGEGSGERAFHVTEEQAFQQRLGQRAAIDRQEQLVLAIAVRMERQRDQFLAGAAVAGNQHGRLGVSDFLDQLQNVANRLALTDDVVELVIHARLRSMNTATIASARFYNTAAMLTSLVDRVAAIA